MMDQISMSAESLSEILSDTVRMCRTVLKSDLSEDEKKRANNALSCIELRTNVMAHMGLPEERVYWNKVNKEILSGNAEEMERPVKISEALFKDIVYVLSLLANCKNEDEDITHELTEHILNSCEEVRKLNN